MKPLIILLFCCISVLRSDAQKSSTSDSNFINTSTVRVQTPKLETETTNTQEFNELRKEMQVKIDKLESDVKERINLYVYFITGILVIIGSAINFFGKSAIKKRVEEIISDTVKNHAEKKIVDVLNSKITNELIENAIRTKSEDEINKILTSIEQRGDNAIMQFNSKGHAAIESMISQPPQSKSRTRKKLLSDADITKENDILRADEFFNIAFESRDQKIKIELYKNVLSIEPNNYHAMNNMAVSYNNLNAPEKAIDLLDKAIELNSNYYQAYSNRAQAYNLLSDYDRALSDVSKCLEFEPTFEFAYAVKGNILTKLKKLEEAEVALNTAIKMNPLSASAYYNRAFFYEERGELEKSLNDYTKADDLNFENKAMLYNNLAVLFRRKKQFDKALDYIEKAKEFNPDFPNIDGTRALIYADIGDDENFYKYLKVALEKGCQAWNYLSDSGFNKYRDTKRLNMLIEPYKRQFTV